MRVASIAKDGGLPKKKKHGHCLSTVYEKRIRSTVIQHQNHIKKYLIIPIKIFLESFKKPYKKNRTDIMGTIWG